MIRIPFPEDEDAVTLGYNESLDALLETIQENFPRATLFVEGPLAADVISFLESVQVNSHAEVTRGTIRPRQRTFHIPVTEETIGGLLDLSVNHAEPEICSHLVVYDERGFLLWAHDAFDGYVLVNADLPADRIEGMHEKLQGQAPPSRRVRNRVVFTKTWLKTAASGLLRLYSASIEERGGELEIHLEQASDLRVRTKSIGLYAGVMWEGPKIYDHHHPVVLTRRWFSREWELQRSPAEAISLIDDRIQQWIRDGAPS